MLCTTSKRTSRRYKANDTGSFANSDLPLATEDEHVLKTPGLIPGEELSRIVGCDTTEMINTTELVKNILE